MKKAKVALARKIARCLRWRPFGTIVAVAEGTTPPKWLI
jgi:hypothetical protein